MVWDRSSGGLVLVAPNTSAQVLFGILITLAYLLLLTKYSPYTDWEDDMLQFVATLAIMLTLQAGFVLKMQNEGRSKNTINNSDDVGGSKETMYEDGLLSILLLLINIFVLCFGVVLSIMSIPILGNAVKLKLQCCCKKASKKNEASSSNRTASKASKKKTTTKVSVLNASTVGIVMFCSCILPPVAGYSCLPGYGKSSGSCQKCPTGKYGGDDRCYDCNRPNDFAKDPDTRSEISGSDWNAAWYVGNTYQDEEGAWTNTRDPALGSIKQGGGCPTT